MRLILFDIDGTLLTGGPAREAFRRALLRVYHTEGAIETHSFAGKTDPQIARELLGGAGLSAEEIVQGMPALWDAYLAELRAGLVERPMRMLPGVPELVGALAGRDSAVALGLVTGNIAEGARLKLDSAGIEHHFPVGSYGSDAERRSELPPIAIRRASEHWQVPFAGEDVVLVGDTPLDMESGRRHGVRTVGVATGRHDLETLCGAGATRAFPDLADTEQVLEVLIG